MGFYRERLVKRPRKVYRCDACGRVIGGEHWSIAVGDRGDFGTARYHTTCYAEIGVMCSGCEFRGDCQGDMGECWRESKSRKAEEV